MAKTVKHTLNQWPDNIVSGDILYGKSGNYDGFYLADASHGLPTFGAVQGDSVEIFNYPGQTEAIAAQLVHRWNCYSDLLEALKDARYSLYGNGPGNPKIDAALAKAEGRS